MIMNKLKKRSKTSLDRFSKNQTPDEMDEFTFPKGTKDCEPT